MKFLARTGPLTWVATLFSALIVTGCSSGSADSSATVAQMEMKSAAPAASDGAVAGSMSAQRQGVSLSLESPRGGLVNGARLASNPTPSQPTQSIISNRMVIRTGTLSVRVENVEQAERKVDAYVNRIGGYVESANSSDLAFDNPQITIELRVPSSGFDASLDTFEGLGVRLSKTVASEDVTEQVVDLDARLKTMGAEEETIRGILRQTRDLDQVLSLQQRLTDIRSNIESMASQRQSLAKKASMSDVTLTLEQSAIIAPAGKDPNWFVQNWAVAATEMGTALRFVATIGIWIVMFCPFWLPLLLIGRRSLRARTTAPS